MTPPENKRKDYFSFEIENGCGNSGQTRKGLL